MICFRFSILILWLVFSFAAAFTHFSCCRVSSQERSSSQELRRDNSPHGVVSRTSSPLTLPVQVKETRKDQLPAKELSRDIIEHKAEALLEEYLHVQDLRVSGVRFVFVVVYLYYFLTTSVIVCVWCIWQQSAVLKVWLNVVSYIRYWIVQKILSVVDLKLRSQTKSVCSFVDSFKQISI